MKNLFLVVISFSIFLLSSAQNNAIIPKWEKGNFKKVTFENISPRIEEGVALYDTIISKFIWEVLEIQDSIVILSLLPLDMELKSDNEAFLNESEFLKNALTLLKEKGVAINYIALTNGVLFTPIESNNLIETFNERYIHSDALNKAISNFPFSKAIQEYIDHSQVHPDSIARFLLLSFIDPIISIIHTPFGQKFNYNQVVTSSSMTEDDWGVFLPSLNFEKSQKLFLGEFQFQDLDENIECTFKFDTEYMTSQSKEEKTSKKKKSSNEEPFQFKFTYSGNYLFNSENNIPIRYFLKNGTIIKKGENDFSKLFLKSILFE